MPVARRILALAALLALAACTEASRPMPPATLFAEVPDRFVLSVTSDADFVYWTDRRFGANGDDGRVLRQPRTGGPAEVLADQQDTPLDLMISESAVYWIDRNPFYLCGMLRRFDRTSGVVSDLTPPDTCLLMPVAERNGRVLVIGSDESSPLRPAVLLAIDPAGAQPPELRVRLGKLASSDYTIRGDRLFLLLASDYGTRAVVRMELDGSSVVLPDAGQVQHFEADDTHVYWVDEHVGGGNDLIRQPQNNFGDYERLAQFDDEPLGRPILDETYVWVPVRSGSAEAPTTAFLRVPLGGGEAERFEAPYAAYLVVPDGERFLVVSHDDAGATWQLLTQPRP